MEITTKREAERIIIEALFGKEVLEKKVYMTLLEDGTLIELKKRFFDGVYTHIGNGSGIKSEQRDLMDISEALRIAKRERIRGVLTRIVKHGDKYLLYYRYKKYKKKVGM